MYALKLFNIILNGMRLEHEGLFVLCGQFGFQTLGHGSGRWTRQVHHNLDRIINKPLKGSQSTYFCLFVCWVIYFKKLNFIKKILNFYSGNKYNCCNDVI